MNSEIKSVVESMKRGKKESLASSDLLVYQLGQMAHLLSIISADAESQSKELAKQTQELINLTKAIKVFTLVLIFIGVIQIVMMIVRP